MSDFERIKRKRNPVLKSNIVDDLIKRLQEYTDKLELEVDKQTKHIQEEKEKSIEIVNQLLPRVVADDLKGKRYNFYTNFKNGYFSRGKSFDTS